MNKFKMPDRNVKDGIHRKVTQFSFKHRKKIFKSI